MQWYSNVQKIGFAYSKVRDKNISLIWCMHTKNNIGGNKMSKIIALENVRNLITNEVGIMNIVAMSNNRGNCGLTFWFANSKESEPQFVRNLVLVRNEVLGILENKCNCIVDISHMMHISNETIQFVDTNYCYTQKIEGEEYGIRQTKYWEYDLHLPHDLRTDEKSRLNLEFNQYGYTGFFKAVVDALENKIEAESILPDNLMGIMERYDCDILSKSYMQEYPIKEEE